MVVWDHGVHVEKDEVCFLAVEKGVLGATSDDSIELALRTSKKNTTVSQ